MQLDNNQKITFVGLIVAILVGSGYYFYNQLLVPASAKEILDIPVTGESASFDAVVFISGAVKCEGVYKVQPQSRIFDVIKIAGGQLPSADFSSINLAEIIKDGQKITIPFKTGILKDYEGSGGSRRDLSRKININMATAQELDELPGVGPATAKQIIEGRPFSKLEDLQKIPRFGKSKFEKIKDKICL